MPVKETNQSQIQKKIKKNCFGVLPNDSTSIQHGICT